LIYGGVTVDQTEEGKLMSFKTKILIYLVILGIFDFIIPIPITALVLIYVLFQEPRWFKEWVEEIYRP
jgi:hypothetical protein